MKCDEVLPLIEDYHDGELDELAAAKVRAHLGVCQHCPAALRELTRESTLYRTYTESVERSLNVTPEMWQAVRSRIASLHAPTPEADESRAGFGERFRAAIAMLIPSSPVMRQVAFALMLVAVSVTATLIAVRTFREAPPPVVLNGGASIPASVPPNARGEEKAPKQPETIAGERASGGKAPSPESPNPIQRVNAAAGTRTTELTPEEYDVFRAMQKIRRAQRDYIEAINVLSASFDRKKSSIDPQVVAAFERNLGIIDRNIAETRKAYDAHPQDAELAQYMLLAYAKKVELLQELAY